jgi:hypothetical protein
MKSYLLEVQHVSLKFNNSSRTSSTVKNPTEVLTQMRLLPTEPPFKVVSSEVKHLKKLRIFFSLM